MISLFWTFAGFIVGLLIVSVFIPPLRDELKTPSPNDKTPLHTKTGCVRFKSVEVPCKEDSSSLNIIASQNK